MLLSLHTSEVCFDTFTRRRDLDSHLGLKAVMTTSSCSPSLSSVTVSSLHYCLRTNRILNSLAEKTIKITNSTCVREDPACGEPDVTRSGGTLLRCLQSKEILLDSFTVVNAARSNCSPHSRLGWPADQRAVIRGQSRRHQHPWLDQEQCSKVTSLLLLRSQSSEGRTALQDTRQGSEHS
jgi:hypothetical protein